MKYFEFVRWGFDGKLLRVRKYEYDSTSGVKNALEGFRHSVTLRNVMSSLVVREDGKVVAQWVRKEKK